MKIILGTLTILALAFACGGKQKVEVEDSEHAVNIGASMCEIFDEKADKQDCVKRLLDALDKRGCSNDGRTDSEASL